MNKTALENNFPADRGFQGKGWLALTIVLAATIGFIANTIIAESRRYKYDFAAYYTIWYAARHRLPLYDPLAGQQSGGNSHLSQVAQQAGIPGKFPHS